MRYESRETTLTSVIGYIKGIAKACTSWSAITTFIYINNNARVLLAIPIDEVIVCVSCLRFVEASNERTNHKVGSQR